MPTYEPFDWYQTPIYYDMIFDVGTDGEATFLEAMLDQYGQSKGRRVLEPACGSGRLVEAMAKRGFRVTGFDLSNEMLAFAKQRLSKSGKRATLERTDMAAFELPGQFDLAHCLVSSFKYLPDDGTAEAHLRCVAAALRPGGVYVLGLHLSEYDVTSCNRERWTAQRDGVSVVCNIQGWPADRKTRTERVRSRLIVNEGSHERRYETHWTFHTYDLPQLKRLTRRVRDVFNHVATYDFRYRIDKPMELDGEQLDNVLILRKRV